MDEEKKRRKNKKKKNKQQNKVPDSVAVTAAESAPVHVIDDRQTSNGPAIETTDAETDVVHNVERRLANGPQAVSQLVDTETQHRLDREAILEQKIKQFQKDKDVQKEKEAILEEKVELLLKEKEIILQKEVTLEDKIVQLQKERDAHMQKAAGLEEKARQLQKEKDSLMQKEAELEMKIMHFENEKQSWLQKEAGFEEKINQLVNEAATLSLKGVSLEEKIKQMERERDSWGQKEKSIKETFTSLDGDNTKLRAEVMELEELRDSILQENQLLKENISGLQSHIQNLEKSAPIPFSSTRRQMDTCENGEVTSEVDAARMLVEKLITENAELVEKVNELYVELARRSPMTEVSISVDSHPESVTAESAYIAQSTPPPVSNLKGEAAQSHETGDQVSEQMLESSKRISSQGERMQSLEEVLVKDERSIRDYLNANDSIIVGNSSEIVQIPLDENEIQVRNSESAYYNEDEAEVALSEAPLIGAPFRLMSFVARYVSGADLVNKKTVNTGG